MIIIMVISYQYIQPGEDNHNDRIILATTTSLDNSGLLNEILPPFIEENQIRVDVVSVGTGKALELGRQGDVDLIMVHSPQAEKEFIDQGYGNNRYTPFYNYYLLLGPPSDPAGVEGTDILTALSSIYQRKASFTSRGDESGTHLKEKELWEKSGVTANNWSPDWYYSTGQGMGATLNIASEKKSYTLCDQATYLTYKQELSLKPLIEEKNRLLRNPYSLITVNPEMHPHLNYYQAKKLTEHILSEETSRLIEDYTHEGEPLFYLKEKAGNY